MPASPASTAQNRKTLSNSHKCLMEGLSRLSLVGSNSAGPWGQDCNYKEETEFPVGWQLTQSGDISLHSLHNDIDGGFGWPHLFVLFHRERGVDVTDANLASLDLSNMPARWVVPDISKEAALLASRIEVQRECDEAMAQVMAQVVWL